MGFTRGGGGTLGISGWGGAAGTLEPSTYSRFSHDVIKIQTKKQSILLRF